MSEFKVIETQDELDKIIKGRLAQKDREVAEQYKDYLSPDDAKAMKADYEKQIEDANKLVTEAQEKLKTYDDTVAQLTKRAETAEVSLLKNKVAIKNNVPIKLADRLVGNTEEELEADAKSFMEGLGGKHDNPGEPPMYIGGPKPNQTNNYDAAMAEFATQITAGMQTN